MKSLKRLCQAIIEAVKRVWLFPRYLAGTPERRRRQAVMNEHEAERLDRIRNPSKYLGK